jgi:hypothetical protein
MNPYKQSGSYKLTCQSCHKAYIGQTGRNLTTRYKEHTRNIRFNKDELAFAQHVLNKQHQCSSMATIMEMVEPAKKENLMNIKENFHIYHLNKNNKLIEEKKSNKESHNQNEMFDIIININTHPQIRHNTQEVYIHDRYTLEHHNNTECSTRSQTTQKSRINIRNLLLQQK